MTRKPILCIDFDGVLHSYASGWKGVAVVSDPPVPGAMDFLDRALVRFDVHIFSSRSGDPDGLAAMRDWTRDHLCRQLGSDRGAGVFDLLHWPQEKPPALVTIDDRAVTFLGEWPDIDALADFQPWNKCPPVPAEAVPVDAPSLDDVYAERNKVVAALAALAVRMGWPAGTARPPIPGWDEAWLNCVYIDLPTGQVSWHYHDRDSDLFGFLPPYRGVWDGHDTAEKYRRVLALRGHAAD